MNTKELLANTGFVQGLARTLVMDEHKAADIAQQTYLAALENPPSKEGSLTAWLSRVTRNMVNLTHRRDKVRTRHEGAASRRRARAPSSRELVEKMEIRRLMIDAVLALDEIYREAIVLRFYDNLKPREMAKQLKLPVETVRTRIKRGVELLRVRLDHLHDGDRKSWCIALAPLAGLRQAKAGAATGASTASAGALLLTVKVKALLAVAIIIAASLGLWQVLDEPIDSSPKPPGLTQANEVKTESNSLATHRGDESATPSPNREEPGREALAPSEPESALALSGEVTWTGTLRDAAGMPLTKGTTETLYYGLPPQISIICKRDNREFSTRCDASGRFEFAGLAPGAYNVSIADFDTSPARAMKPLPLPDMVLAKPGMIEKDLRIPKDAGAVVSGRVLDQESGMSGQWDRCQVVLVPERKPDHCLLAPVDPEEGAFRFPCVAPDRYRLILQGPGLNTLNHSGRVHAKAGDIIDDLEFTMPALGMLRLGFNDFSDEETKELSIHFKPDSGYCGEFHWPWKTNNLLPVPEGNLQVAITHETLGRWDRTVQITGGEETELIVFRHDFDGFEPVPFTLMGMLRRGDGTPVTGAALQLSPQSGAAGQRGIKAMTDEQGRFTCPRFTPGRWGATAILITPETAPLLKSRQTPANFAGTVPIIHLDGIQVPHNPSSDYVLDLVIPAGEVKATLRNQRTGQAPAKDLPISAVAVNAHGYGLNSEVSTLKGMGVDELRFQGLPDGSYSLVIRVTGYRCFTSKNFDLKDGQALDLGELKLEPSGIIDLEVLDPGGEPLGYDTAYLEGEKLGSGTSADEMRLPDGKTRYWELPHGKVTLEVKRKGYRTKTILLQLEPAVPQAVQVILEPESENG